MRISKAWIGKDVVVWPRRGEGFVLCIEQDREGIVPAVSGGADGQPQGLIVAPFLKGKLTEVDHRACIVQYQMPPEGSQFCVAINLETVASITIAHPENARKSSLLIGVP